MPYRRPAEGTELLSRQFTCRRCGGTFTAAWSREDAEAEAVERFGEMPRDGVSICDDCDAEFMAWWTSLTPERRAELERLRKRETG